MSLTKCPHTLHVIRATQPTASDDYSPRTRVAPAGMDKYFEEVLEPVQDRLAAIPAVTDPLIGRMVGAGPKHGIEFVRDCRHRATQQ